MVCLAVVLLAGLVAGGARAADRGPLKYAEGAFDAASGVYTAVKGDDLAAIAARFGVPVAELKAQNQLASDQIEVGRKLVIAESPRGTAASTGSAAVAPAVLEGKPGPPGGPGTLEFPNSRVLPIPTPPFAGTIMPNLIDSTPGWPPTIAPPEGAPNVLLVLIDDAGSPPTRRSAALSPRRRSTSSPRGLRYTQMHNTALCSPTRAALLAGRNHHVAGYGNVAEATTGYPGYDAVTGPDAEHGAMTLELNGYSTAWFGKNHNVPIWTAAPTGPFDQFPVGRGYEYFYGFVGGDTSQLEPGSLYRNTTPIYPYVGQAGKWNLITAMADDAIACINQNASNNPKRP